MKKYSLYTFISLVMLVLVTSCAEDTTPSLSGNGAASVSYDSEVKTEYTFTSATSWIISGYDSNSLTISPTSGSGGSCTLSIMLPQQTVQMLTRPVHSLFHQVQE